MPITGHFEGDFAKFTTAVENAQASLKSFESDGAKVETRLTSLGNSLSGVKVVQQATLAAEAVARLGEAGGVSAGILKLTDSELQRIGASAQQAAEKLRALGQDVPQGIQAIADAAKAARTEGEGMASSFASWGAGMVANIASGELLAHAIERIGEAALEAAKALPEMVMHTIEVGNSLYEMSLKTGASVENLSRLRYVASQTGIDFQSFPTIFAKMEQGLGQVGTKAEALQKHLDDLHLNLKTLRDEHPDQAFLDIVSALEKIQNPAQRAADGMAIFGRGWKEMAALGVESVQELMDEADKLGLTVTTMSAAADHAAKTGFATLGMQLESIEMRIGQAFVPALVGLTRDVGVVLTDALTKANGKLDDMGKGGGFLATVSQAMGTGNGALAAQIKLYEMLRDGIVSFVRSAIEPTVTALTFLAQELDAVRVIAHLIPEGIQVITYEVERFLLASIKLKQFTDPLNAKAYDAEADQISKDMDRLYDSFSKHQLAVNDLKKSEEDWGKGGATAVKAIEEALTKFGATHADIEGIITHFANVAKNAYGGASTAVDGASKKMEDAAAALAAAQIPLTEVEKGRAEYLLSMGLREEQVALLMGKNVIQIHNYVEAGKQAEAITKMWAATIAEWTKQAAKFVEEGGNAINKANEKEADAIAHQNTTTMAMARDFHDRVNEMNMTGTELALAQIDRQQRATNDAFDKEHDKTTWYYLQARAEADAYYAHLRDLLNHSTATIEEEMARQGVLSKNQLETQATNQRLIYNAMVQDGGYSTQQLEAQWIKADEAKKAADNGWAANSAHVFSELESGFSALADSSNAAFASLMKDLDTFMQGLQAAQQAGEEMAAAYANDDIAGMAAATMKGAAALDKVTSSGSDAARVMKGAATGAEMGYQAFGIYGAAVGAAAGAIVGFVKASTAGRKAVEDFATAQGGFDTLHAKLDALPTGQGEELWKELTQGTAKGDPKAAQAAIDKITAALAAGDAATKQFDTDAGGVFQKIAALGGNVDASMLPYLNDLAKANKLSTDNIALLGTMSGDGKPTYEQLDALAKKYNLTLDQMGSGFQTSKINDEFQSLIDDMDEMQRGGVDMTAILTKVGTDGTLALSDLGTSIQTTIDQAKKYGQDVPENMKPATQSLIDQGLLLDENGNKITDINQIKFGESMQTSLDKLNLTLQSLIDTLTGKGPNSVKGALDVIGNTTVSPTIAPKIVMPEMPGVPAGTTPDYGGAQAEGGDYYVTRPTMFLAGEAGPESVSFGGANNKRFGGSSATTGPIHIHVVMPDGRTLAEVVVPHIPVVVQEYGLTR
jgi:hypothetical protein